MDTQLDLFDAVEEAQANRNATWRQLPEQARARVRDLFAALAIKHLQATIKRNECDEQQREN